MPKKAMTLAESTSKAGAASMRKRTAKERSEFGRRAVRIRWSRARNPRGADGKFIKKK